MRRSNRRYLYQSRLTKLGNVIHLQLFGGIVAVSRDVDTELATAISQGDKFLEVVVAPSFSREAADNYQ